MKEQVNVWGKLTKWLNDKWQYAKTYSRKCRGVYYRMLNT